MNRSSDGPDQNSLRPNSFVRPASIHLMSPSSDIVGPSPVTSNGTEATEIEDDIADEHVMGSLVPHPSVSDIRILVWSEFAPRLTCVSS